MKNIFYLCTKKSKQLNPKTRKGNNKMKQNSNNTNERAAAIVNNERRVMKAIKAGNHTTREIIEAADMYTEYREFCEAIAALQCAGLVESREDGYYFTEKGEYITEYGVTDPEEEAAAEYIVNTDESKNDNEPTNTPAAASETATANENEPQAEDKSKAAPIIAAAFFLLSLTIGTSHEAAEIITNDPAAVFAQVAEAGETLTAFALEEIPTPDELPAADVPALL